jgi:hypothetical protein
MTNRSKNRGTAAESAVVKWLQAHGWPACERRALAGNSDRGDVAGIADFCGEVKDCKSHTYGPWLRELDVEMTNSGARFGAVIAKRRGTTDVGEWFAVMPVRVLADLMKEAGR